METQTLSAVRRTLLGKKVKAFRLEGQSPAVMYGVSAESTPITINTKEFLAVYAQSGESTLIDVSVDGETPIKALVSDLQVHPVTSRLLHVDFRRIDLSKKITTNVPLTFEGESVAVKTMGGTFVASLHEVEIECLPTDLVHSIVINISSLATFDDVITVAGITAPKGIVIKATPETIVALVQAPRSEEELKALDAAVVADVSHVEKVEKKKKEEDVVEEKK